MNVDKMIIFIGIVFCLIGFLFGFFVIKNKYAFVISDYEILKNKIISNLEIIDNLKEEKIKINEKNIFLENSKLENLENMQKIQKKYDSLLIEYNQSIKEKDILNEKYNSLHNLKKEIEEKYKNFNTEFENISRKIIQESTEKLNRDSSFVLEKTIKPFNDKFMDFENKVMQFYSNEKSERVSLTNEINKIVDTHQKLYFSAENLTKALKGENKTHGNWGEFQLEKILEESGLRKNSDYLVQETILDDLDGNRLIPDVIINLPDKKHIIIDSKVSLVAYEKYYSTDDDVEKEKHLKDFLISIKGLVKNLASKEYNDKKGMNSIDLVLMFMPIESAYMLAISKEPEIFKYAWDKKVVIVSPTTLFATLKTVAYIRRIEKQSKNVEEIATIGGKMCDQLHNFLEKMDNLDKCLIKSKAVYDDSLKTLNGRGSLLSNAKKMKELGAKSSKNIDNYLIEEDNL
jgi:DNA recombination protein RmuC